MERLREDPVAAWLDHLRVERGLAANTLAAYERDLAALAAFAAKRRVPLVELGHKQLADFVGSLRERGLSARSQARRVSRSAASTPSRFAKGSRPPTRPRTFAAAGVPRAAALPHAAADRRTPRGAGGGDRLGLRDRAILEVLYATGLRASELRADARRPGPRAGRRARLGKGSKERLVPLGREAQRWTRRYLDQTRPFFARAPRPPCVPEPARRASRHGPVGNRQAPCRHGGRPARAHAARPAALVRHPPARARGRPAGAAGDARARGHLDDPDLHPREPERLRQIYDKLHPRA